MGDNITNRKVYQDFTRDSISQRNKETIPSTPDVSSFAVQPKGSLVYDNLTQIVFYSNGTAWLPIDTIPIHLNVDLVASTIIPAGDTVIRWPNVREDTHNMYNPTTGVTTVPSDGLWEMTVKVLINQSAAGSGQPAAFYQHILSINKNTPWPDGNTTLFADFLQEHFLMPQLPKQVVLQYSGIIRLSEGDELTFNVVSVTFSPTTLRDTGIGAGFCLNCMTMTRIGS
jgi:hypothetical protein